jgi:hypothetical protein
MTNNEMIVKLTSVYPINVAGAKKIIADLKSGEELDCDIYDSLFTFYCDNGQMPYGTATAKDGDPIEWITEQIKITLEIQNGLF